MDVRVFRKGSGGAPAPAEAVGLAFLSRQVALYDLLLDIEGSLLVEGGPSTPLLSALMRRAPSRAAKSEGFPPFMDAEIYFAVPASGQPTGAILRLHMRPRAARGQQIRIDDLPVPGVQ